MANLIWKDLDNSHREYYIYLLKVFGALSGLFKDTTGVNGRKPYLYYRNHEIIFIKSFHADDLSRNDSAFDAVIAINDVNIGVGLKTWIHTTDYSNQKVAEFNRHSSELRELFNLQDPMKVICRICELRNERIEDDVRRNNTKKEVYHIVTRDEHAMHIIETDYKKIDVTNITQITKNLKSVSFYDGHDHYNFNMSKTTLFRKFNVSKAQIVRTIPVEIFENPFEMLEELYNINKSHEKQCLEAIVIPLYNDKSFKVDEKSKFNASLGSSKTKNSSIPRPAYEAYAPIPVFIHYLSPNFFGINALDADQRKHSAIKLHLPTGEIIQAKITQDNGKALQSNPQSALGKWLLYNIFGLKPYELLTKELIDKKGYDSLVVSKIDDFNFKIDLADYLTYEKWKLERKEQIEGLVKKKNMPKRAVPRFRPELFKESD